MRRLGLLLGVLGLLLLGGWPQLTHAATSTTACACYCGTPEAGAKYKSMVDQQSDCQAKCTAPNEIYIGCFDNSNNYPAKSDVCWTQAQCEEVTGQVWDDKVPNCSDDEPGNIHMGYCYSAPPTINVMTVIGGKTQFNTIGDYISAVYQMLIPFMSVVAVVMIMIGGLQYTLARGNPKAIAQAKERITKAVIGFVLLLCAYALANLLDPSLTHLRLLRIPMVKQVVLLDPNSTCEYLNFVGYEIDGPAKFAAKSCGTTGYITGTDNVKENVIAGAWEKGDPCQYSQCTDGGACTAGTTFTGTVGYGSDSTVEQVASFTCQKCKEMVGTAASATACASHQATGSEPLTTADGTVINGKNFYCEYIPGTEVTIDGTPFTTTDSACFDISLDSSNGAVDCTSIRAVQDTGGSCVSYNLLQFNWPKVNSVGSSPVSKAITLAKGYTVPELAAAFKDVCSSDPCHLAREDGGVSGCLPLESSTGIACIGKTDTGAISTTTTTVESGGLPVPTIAGYCWARKAGVKVNCNTGIVIH